MSSSDVVPIGRRMTPLWVWKLMAAPMLGCATQKSTIARTSGSLVGIRSGAHLLELLAPQRREVAVQVEALAVAVDAFTRTPSQALSVPSGMTRKYSPPISPGSRAIIRRGSCGCLRYVPCGSGMRM